MFLHASIVQPADADKATYQSVDVSRPKHPQHVSCACLTVKPSFGSLCDGSLIDSVHNERVKVLSSALRGKIESIGI